MAPNKSQFSPNGLRYLYNVRWFAKVLAVFCYVDTRLYTKQKHTKQKHTKQKQSTNGLRLLAIMENRFRGDIDCLERAGNVKVYRMPSTWLGRFYEQFYTGQDSRKAQLDPKIYEKQQEYQKFLRRFLRLLISLLNIDAVIGSGMNYKTTVDWGAVLNEIGIPYLVFHREGFMGSKHETDYVLDFSKYGRTFEGTKLIVQTELMRQLLVKSRFVDPKKVTVGGTMRMDRLVCREEIESKMELEQFDQDRWVTLFSFGVGVGTMGGYWPEGWKNGKYFYQTCLLTHASVAKYALLNPDQKVMIKLKWGGEWRAAVNWLLQKEGIYPDKIPNLCISSTVDAQVQARRSAVVIGYGSTTLLESMILGLPVIIPGFGEVSDEKFQDLVTYPDINDCFDIASTPEEMISMISDSLVNGQVTNRVMGERHHAFERYLSFMNGTATNTCLQIIKETLASS